MSLDSTRPRVEGSITKVAFCESLCIAGFVPLPSAIYNASLLEKVDSGLDSEVKDTRRFIEMLLAGAMPAKIMINTHPQRWDDRIMPWVMEMVAQNLKNEIKRRIRRG